jgi:hypothetical protein
MLYDRQETLKGTPVVKLTQMAAVMHFLKELAIASQIPMAIVSMKPMVIVSMKPMAIASMKPMAIVSEKPMAIALQKPMAIALQKPMVILSEKPMAIASGEPRALVPCTDTAVCEWPRMPWPRSLYNCLLMPITPREKPFGTRNF